MSTNEGRGIGTHKGSESAPLVLSAINYKLWWDLLE